LCHATASYRITDDWRENPNGQSYLEGIRGTGSPDVQRRAEELLTHLGPEISAVEERFAREHGWTPNQATRVWETNPEITRTPKVGIPVSTAAEAGSPDWLLRAEAGGFLAHAKYKGEDDVVFGFYPSLQPCDEARTPTIAAPHSHFMGDCK
jgi:hypothetical protein